MMNPTQPGSVSRPGDALLQQALHTGQVAPEALALLPRAAAERFRVLPLERRGDVLSVAMIDDGDVYLIDELQRITGCRIVPISASPGDIQAGISRVYAESGTAAPAWGEPGELRTPDHILVLDGGPSVISADAPIVLLLNELILEAIQQRASDLHIEPHENEVLIRFRIDGVLVDWRSLTPDQHAPLTSRVKVLSNMDIAEHRLPLDGRFTIQVRGQRWDVRVSTIPGIFGEKAVLRLLPKDVAGLALEDLGMLEEDRRAYETFITRPFGMVLVTGPTGSGKTTTLYASLRRLDCVGKNVLTIEDPVEYELPRVTQMQVHPKIGLTFATGLRHILRQDPDIIMVGEIRDSETLAMAVQAALTGHLVFSTLHCNDAASAAARALDMGLEPYLFTSSVIGVVAQRLVRRVCQNCKTLEPLPPAVRQRFGVADPRAGYYRGRGCQQCRHTGYRGRVGIFELLSLTERVKQAIHERRSASEIKAIATQEGFRTLRDDAIRKVQMGLTTPEEVLRAVWLTDEG